MVNSGVVAHPVSKSHVAASGAMPQWTPLSLATRGTMMKKQKTQHDHRKTNVRQLVLETRTANISSLEQQCTMAEEDYYTEETQSRPLTHSQIHQVQNAAEHVEIKHTQAWTKEEIREVIWCYMYCKQHFADSYEKL